MCDLVCEEAKKPSKKKKVRELKISRIFALVFQDEKGEMNVGNRLLFMCVVAREADMA